MPDRVAETCTVCNQTDTHPKDHSNDGTSAHLDCRPAGWSAEIDALLERADGKRGDELVTFLEEATVDQVSSLQEEG